MNSTAVKILYLENICIFCKYKFSSGWHKADFPVNEAFQIHLSSSHKRKQKKKKRLLLSFNHHQGYLSNSFSQIVKISFPIIHNSLKVC